MKTRVKFSLSLVAVIGVMTLVAGVVVGRASGGSDSGGGGGGGGAASGKEVDVIIKASDSSFWQTMLAGAKKAGADYGVKVGLFGPTSETDIGSQVQLVENAISRGVDAIVLAPNSSDALDNVIKRARKSGDGAARASKDNKAAGRIPVVAFDTDPAENAALRDGSIDALVVQNPYFFGYQGVVEAGMAAVGTVPPRNLDPGAVVADKTNMDSSEVKQLLNPPTAKAG